jgi:hypothetical protein
MARFYSLRAQPALGLTSGGDSAPSLAAAGELHQILNSRVRIGAH